VRRTAMNLILMMMVALNYLTKNMFLNIDDGDVCSFPDHHIQGTWLKCVSIIT
jgi:hypothetical protein